MNECFNFLTITGEKTQIKKILETVIITTDTQIPMLGGNTFEPEFEINGEDENSIDVQFISPWHPPINWLQSLVTDYDVTIHCEYEEEGEQIAGEIMIDKYSFAIKLYTDWKQYYIDKWGEEAYYEYFGEEEDEIEIESTKDNLPF